MTRKLRELEPEDFKLMKLPREFWGVKAGDLPQLAGHKVAKYIANAESFANQGLSLYISGARGSGKTRSATFLLRHLRGLAYDAHFTTMARLRAAQLTPTYDDEVLIQARVRSVEVLLVDGVTADDLGSRVFGLHDLTTLLRERLDERRPTFVTVRAASIDEATLRTPFSDVWGEIQHRYYHFHLPTPTVLLTTKLQQVMAADEPLAALEPPPPTSSPPPSEPKRSPGDDRSSRFRK